MPLKRIPLTGVIAAALAAVVLTVALGAAGVIDLPGNLRQDLGLAQATPNPPCEVGLYRRVPRSSTPPPPGRWRLEKSLAPRAPVEGSAVAIGPLIYVTNGSGPDDLRTVFTYDARSGRWHEPTQTPTGLNHSQPVTYRGDLYLAGGYLEGEDPTSRFWRYRPEKRQWTELPSMRQPRGGGGTAVIGHQLYVAAGAPQTFGAASRSIPPYGTLEIYDFRTGRWTPGPDLPHARHHVGAAALGGKLYVAGGRDESDNSSTGFDRYDPETGNWDRLPPLPFGVASAGVTAAGGKVIVVGGEDLSGWEEGGGWVTPTAWSFDPRTERWTRLPDLDIERRAQGAATVGDRIYTLVGSPCPGLGPEGPVGTPTVESLPVSVLGTRARRSGPPR